MKKSFEDYTRLAGSHGMKGSLWLGPDHLLVVEGKGFILPFREHYRRIDYSNIQALVMVKRSAWLWWLIICGLGAIGFGFLAWSAWQEIVGIGITLGLISFVLGLFSIMQLIKGPTCHSFVQTAVQVLRLKSLGRMRTAHFAFREIESLCREHQSHIPVPDMEAQLTQMAPPLPASGASMDQVIPQSNRKPWTGSLWVWASGVLTLLWGVLIAAELYVPDVWFLWFGVIVGALAFVCSLIGIVKVIGSLVPAALTISLSVTLALQLLAGIAFYVVLSITSAFSGDIMEQMQMTQSFARLAAFESDGVVEYIVVPLGCLLALTGLLILSNARARVKITDVAQPVRPPTFEGAPPTQSDSNE